MSETGLKHLMETRVPFSEYRKLADTVARLRAINAELVAALEDIHALVCGECPSLLNEDSGGNAKLDAQIRTALVKAREQV